MFGATPYETVLIDWKLPEPGPDGLEVCRRIRGISLSTLLIFVTARDSTEDIVEALGAGADEYVIKPFDAAALLARIAALVRRSSLPPAFAPPDRLAPANDGTGVSTLVNSGRQQQILDCISRGLANKEIASVLGCSVKNVEYHLGRMLRKTNCSSRAELAARTRRRGSATS
jgi:DNA-binding NarL/FixJ family response regulator